jgi:hypothetical protein
MDQNLPMSSELEGTGSLPLCILKNLCLQLLEKLLIRSPLEELTTYQILEKILGSQAFTCPCCLEGRMIHDPSLKKIRAPN